MTLSDRLLDVRQSFQNWLASLGHGWQAPVALLVVSLLDLVLSDALTLASLLPGESALESDPAVLLFYVVLFALALGSWLLRRHRLARTIILFYAGVITAQLMYSAAELVFTLPVRTGGAGGFALLWDAFIVWAVNVVIFTVWYWLADGGGPEQRTSREGKRDFVFPQQANGIPCWAAWQPGFVDYLFLAFNTSTSFGPTDTLVLSRRGKVLMMAQSAISLVTLAMLAARAINIIA